jgi:protein TonB
MCWRMTIAARRSLTRSPKADRSVARAQAFRREHPAGQRRSVLFVEVSARAIHSKGRVQGTRWAHVVADPCRSVPQTCVAPRVMRDRPRAGRPQARPRWGVKAVVLLMHILVVAGLIRAFTPDFVARVSRSVTQAFTIEAPLPPSPTPAPSTQSPSSAAPRDEGVAAAAGRRADPREAAVPPAKVIVRPTQAPPVPGQGRENAAGAAAQGEGTGASGSGLGTGAGRRGAGQGGGGRSSPTVKIAGDINSARDYPRAGRDRRIGSSVIIDISVGKDGRVSECRVVQPSGDPEADRITCALATQRFRFRPALDNEGNPVEAVFRWRQRWFY